MRSLSARRAWIEITHGTRTASRYTVALRKESVDRNRDVCQSSKLMYQGSLSARRAWIEITYSDGVVSGSGVALRKESVDRNKYVVQCRKVFGVSLSARRAWIEISITI